MKIQLLTVSVVVLSVCACGPRAQISGGKQGASEALYAASGPMKGGADKYGSKIDVTGSVSVKCAEGGSATLSGFGVAFGSGGLTDIAQSFTAEYSNCGVMTGHGVAALNGALKVVQAVKVATGAVDIDQSMKGKLLWQGACDDFLDIDVTQKVSAGALTQTSGGDLDDPQGHVDQHPRDVQLRRVGERDAGQGQRRDRRREKVVVGAENAARRLLARGNFVARSGQVILSSCLDRQLGSQASDNQSIRIAEAVSHGV